MKPLKKHKQKIKLPSKKTVVAVFAHPDDEAFGPAGTIAKLAKENDVYLLCATKGEVGIGRGDLGKVRSKELLRSARILGIKKVYFLGFVDGTLSNSLYHKLAKKIEEKFRLLKPEVVLTVENRGVSGHLDHITVSMVTTYVFKRLPFIKTLLYSCLLAENRSGEFDNYFIYFPPGYKRSEIDLVVDVKDTWDLKIKAMMAHKSQIKDAKRIILRLQDLSKKEEYFLAIKK